MDPFKVALLINSKLEDAGDPAIYRERMGARELRMAGDNVVIVFDGAGSIAAAEMAQPGHLLHTLFTDVLPAVHSVCRFCAKSGGVLDAVLAAELPLLEDDRGQRLER